MFARDSAAKPKAAAKSKGKAATKTSANKPVKEDDMKFPSTLLSALNQKDMKALDIHSAMKLSSIESECKKYLVYHRENIFKKS